MGLGSVDRPGYLGRRLFSLAGVVPLGVFVVVYLWTAANAMRGREAFEAAWAEWTMHPFAWAIEVFGFWLPLAYHAGYGLKVMFEGRSNVRRYPYGRNLMFLLQRVSGIAALAFIVFHAWRFELREAASANDKFGLLCGELSSTSFGLPLLASAYLVGLAAVVFHLSNGLHGFCRTWGIVATRRAAKRAAGWFGVLGVALYIVASSTVIYFATGSRVVLAPALTTTTRLASGCSEPPQASTADTVLEAVQ